MMLKFCQAVSGWGDLKAESCGSDIDKMRNADPFSHGCRWEGLVKIGQWKKQSKVIDFCDRLILSNELLRNYLLSASAWGVYAALPITQS